MEQKGDERYQGMDIWFCLESKGQLIRQRSAKIGEEKEGWEEDRRRQKNEKQMK